MAAASSLKDKIGAIPQGQAYTVGQYLPLDQIRTDGGTQARAGLDAATVAEYAESWLTLSSRQNGFLEMPLITVYHDGKDYWLADGFHRVAAYKQFLESGKSSASPHAVRAEVRQGTRRDAVLFACGANATHGLRRTQADKRRAIVTLLEDTEWRQWSDSEIARRVNVDHKTVASVRADLYPGNSQDSRTVTRGGTTYEQKVPERRTLGPGQPPPEPWPEAPEGWRWNRRGAPAHLIAPGGWRTADYNVPARALAEAEQYMLTLSPFWQSIDAHHPTAHFWTRERPDLLRSACGMTVQNRLPSGSREASHCSSCVRATWKEQSAEKQAGSEVAPVETDDRPLMIDSLSEVQLQSSTPAETDDSAIITEIRAKAGALGLGVIWEDDTVILHWPDEDIESLMGMGYSDALHWLATEGQRQAQERAAPVWQPPQPAVLPTAAESLPAVPPRPKRPVSADASAVIVYLRQMETYASALESVIQALQKQIK